MVTGREPIRLSHELVICTRNRPDDLAEAIATVEAQTRPFDSVLVVDSSDARDTEQLVRARMAERPELRYLASAAGLTLQRNRGVEHSTGEVLHFVDDDVQLEPDYLEQLASTFEGPGSERVVGAGGLITNLPPRNPRLWWRLALMDSRRQGAVLPSGVNVMVTSLSQPQRVDWLSGCSMSFRRWVCEQLRFDEELAGYAMTEDVDFSVRAGRLGSLVVNPAARLVHNVSPVERWNFERRTRASVYRRGWFVEKNMRPANRLAFWWSVVASVVLEVVLAIGALSRWRLKIAWWRIRGALDFLNGSR